jgi:hypothetical protein
MPNRIRVSVREVDFVGPVTHVRVDPLNVERGRLSLMVKLPSTAGGPSFRRGRRWSSGGIRATPTGPA